LRAARGLRAKSPAEPAGEAPPPPLPVAVEDVRVEPYERGQHPGGDLDLVEIARRSPPLLVDGDPVPPRAHRTAALLGPDLVGGIVEAGDVDLVLPGGQHAE